VEQAPPPGTITRESAASAPDEPTTSLDSSGAPAIPVPVTASLLARGQNRFGIYCAVCHGATALGGSLVALNMGPPRPPPLRGAFARSTLPPAYVHAVITHGLGRMPAYAPQLTAYDRWAVVAYVEHLRAAAVSGAAAVDDSLRAAEIARIDTLAAERRGP
jgi:mono/diheme cytochrome c family protein